MTINISQHGNLAGYVKTGVLSAPIVAAALTSASVSTAATGAEYFRAVADGGSFLGVVGGGILGSSTAALSSTNAMRLPANVPEIFGLNAGQTVMAAST